MSKVYFDSTELTNCSKILDNAIRGFDKSIGASSGLDVPDFAYQGWLNSLPSLLEEYKAKCKEDQTWVETSNFKLTEELNSSEKEVSSVEVQTDLVKELSVN